MVIVLSVCLSVAMKSAAYIVMSKSTYHRVLSSAFKGFVSCGFCSNASFKSSGVIFWSPPPSSLPGKLLMDKQV